MHFHPDTKEKVQVIGTVIGEKLNPSENPMCVKVKNEFLKLIS